MTQKKKFSLVKSIAVIALSTILFSAIFYAALGRIHQIKKKRLESDKFSIKSLIHTSYQKYALASIYLEELMNLSCDRPTNIFCFDKEVATKKLLESPVIKQVNICLENPDTIKVDYEIRKPLAWCYDFENIVIDEEGYLLPLYPFFSPKILTEMYFGLETFEGFDEPIKGKHVDLAMQLFHMLHSEGDATTFFIKRIDVSNAFSPSYGKREVVVVLEHEAFSPDGDRATLFAHILRLSTKNYAQELGNYFSFKEEILCKDAGLQVDNDSQIYEVVIDLRSPGIAFIDENPKLKVRKT